MTELTRTQRAGPECAPEYIRRAAEGRPPGETVAVYLHGAFVARPAPMKKYATTISFPLPSSPL